MELGARQLQGRAIGAAADAGTEGAAVGHRTHDDVVVAGGRRLEVGDVGGHHLAGDGVNFTGTQRDARHLGRGDFGSAGSAGQSQNAQRGGGEKKLLSHFGLISPREDGQWM
ncbi:hypothetical protein D3C87_1444590 [compost metagenome]